MFLPGKRVPKAHWLAMGATWYRHRSSSAIQRRSFWRSLYHIYRLERNRRLSNPMIRWSNYESVVIIPCLSWDLSWNVMYPGGSTEVTSRRSLLLDDRVITLTHRGWDKMAAIWQTTFSNVFSWMKMYEFRLRFHWSLFLRFQSTIFQHWFR